MRDDIEMLRRTAAILLSLATLADWVADRSRPVRWLVALDLAAGRRLSQARMSPTSIRSPSNMRRSSWLTATTKRFALPQHSACLQPYFSQSPIRCSVWRSESLPNNPIAAGCPAAARMPTDFSVRLAALQTALRRHILT